MKRVDMEGDGWVTNEPLRTGGFFFLDSNIPSQGSFGLYKWTDWLLSHVLIVFGDRPVKYVGGPYCRWKARVQPIIGPVGRWAPNMNMQLHATN